MPEHKTLSPTLKPPEFTRDAMGRFERPGATLKKIRKALEVVSRRARRQGQVVHLVCKTKPLSSSNRRSWMR